MEEYSQQLSENTEDSWELYASTILETYQEALESAAYGEDETAQITLSRTDSDTWTVSSQDVDSLIQKLLDVSVLEDSAADTAQSLQTEATPDTADPEEIASADTAQVGQTVSLSREGTAMADFSIDRVEVTMNAVNMTCPIRKKWWSSPTHTPTPDRQILCCWMR